jgi:hypothetical protein
LKSKVFLVGIAAILLSLITVTVPVAAEESPVWYYKDYAPKRTFIHYWNGTLLRTAGGKQFWELYSELMMMMPGGSMMGDGVEWVKMTIMWDPLAQNGHIIRFDHHGNNLQFTGWEGTIWFNPVYHFNVSGVGSGWYRVNGTWYSLVIPRGSFAGEYYPDNDASPFVSGNSSATERALLTYGLQPVGGYLASVDVLAVLAPYLASGGLFGAIAVSVVAIRKKHKNFKN